MAQHSGGHAAPGPPADPAAASMPQLGHLGRADFEEIYEPAEDTYLFVDTLHSQRDALRAHAPAVCLEVGGGSGCLTAALAAVLDGPAAFFVTDINPRAALASQQTAAANAVRHCSVVQTDLVSGLATRLAGKVDVMLFNPPYVVTPTEEISSSMIARAWAGGVDGREVTDRLLPQIPSLLAPGGILYLVVLPENKPEDICQRLLAAGMSSAAIISARRAFNERLMILKAIK